MRLSTRKMKEVDTKIKQVEFVEKPFEGKSQKEIIEQIHEDFYTEVDKLLSYAKIKEDNSSKNPELLDKANRLRKFGFTGTSTVELADSEESRVGNINRENEDKDRLKEVINYFSVKYPMYKFITEDSVKKICEKYNLIYGDVKNFKGDVPEKNLQDIENFKIKDEDLCFERRYSYTYRNYKFDSFIHIDSEHVNSFFYAKNTRANLSNSSSDPSTGLKYTVYLSPLEIAAPLKDFNTEKMQIEDFKLSKIEIPDPVVLQPVLYKGSKYYLIVTAWGDEASDELVVNQILN